MPDDVEANTGAGAAGISSNCDTYTIWLQPQSDLELAGVGASGQVYNVDYHIVLKACRVFQQPRNDASENDQWHYASDTIFHSNLMQNERTVLQLLQKKPHAHIMEAVSTDYPEGVYLRKYRPLPKETTSLCRVQWYCDIVDALCHLHGLSIAHADIRSDNVMLNEKGYAILCDFSAASPFYHPNPVFPHLPLTINGPSQTLSELTDMFAMASLIFEMENGIKPALSVDSCGALVLPQTRTHPQDLDTTIRNAWLGRYKHTSEMLRHLRSIDTTSNRGDIYTAPYPESVHSLKYRVKKWREAREDKFGKNSQYLCLSTSMFLDQHVIRLCS